jgi:hypothetical protein
MIEVDKIPEEIRDRFKDDLSTYGEWATSHFNYMAPFGGMLQELKDTDTDFVWFITTIRLITLFGSQDPLPTHFSTAREFLKEQNIEDDKAIDMLARALVEECRDFKKFILEKFDVKNITIQKTASEAYLDEHVKSFLCSIEDLPNEIKRTFSPPQQQKPSEEIILTQQTSSQTPLFLDTPIKNQVNEEQLLSVPVRTAYPDFTCSQDRCNAVDLAFSEFLQKTGKHGQNCAKEIKESAPYRHKKYQETGYSKIDREGAWSVWIPKDRTCLFSPFLYILVDAIWNDKIQHRWGKEKKNVPALPTLVLMKTIKPSLSKDTKIITEGTTITCYSENGKIISSVPCVDPKLVPLIRDGLEAFSSLSGHKLLRWEVRTGFENWVSEEGDPRLIRTSGGYEGIANLAGCGKNSATIKEIKNILYAQAHGQFIMPNGNSGNMISLMEIEKHRNGEPSKINIVVGEMLLPDFTHKIPKGEGRRLVPITDLPPLIGSKNTYAAQAMLQILVLEEFSKQSDMLATRKCVFISQNRWEELAREAKLQQSYICKVIAGWTEDDLFAKAFLQKQGDEYTLGIDYAQVSDFLEAQGKQRQDGAIGGQKSAEAKKNLAKRKYISKKKGEEKS